MGKLSGQNGNERPELLSTLGRFFQVGLSQRETCGCIALMLKHGGMEKASIYHLRLKQLVLLAGVCAQAKRPKRG